jgi:hypothetical protein
MCGVFKCRKYWSDLRAEVLIMKGILVVEGLSTKP